MSEVRNNITISDVAEALGISKTTVSRAISGKGRIGEETRQKVLTYIKENNYKPNPMAQGLATQRTYNIGWVVPGDSSMAELPFFQRCMSGVCEIATTMNYDVLISLVSEGNVNHLKRIVENKKVDGVIMGRTLVDDKAVKYLKKSGIPFVVIGSTHEKKVIQIDNDHVNACREITSILILKGIKKPALIGGHLIHVVNESRLKGYKEGLESQGIPVDPELLYLNNVSERDIHRSVDSAIAAGTDCLVCMDDGICNIALSKLRKDGISVPGDVKVASFYNSEIQANHQPAVTTLQYDPKELGNVACRTLFKVLDGEKVPEKTLLGYEVLLKGSTL